MTRHGQTRLVQKSWESCNSAAVSLWSLMPKMSMKMYSSPNCEACSSQAPASFNPSLLLGPPPFLHPSICYTLPIYFHLSAWDCSPGGKNGSGQRAEAVTYSESDLRKVFSTSFHFLSLWNGDSESASCILATQTLLIKCQALYSCQVPLLQTL